MHDSSDKREHEKRATHGLLKRTGQRRFRDTRGLKEVIYFRVSILCVRSLTLLNLVSFCNVFIYSFYFLWGGTAFLLPVRMQQPVRAMGSKSIACTLSRFCSLLPRSLRYTRPASININDRNTSLSFRAADVIILRGFPEWCVFLFLRATSHA